MDEQYCHNCQRNICAANFASHSAFCERNIKVCKLCNEPVPISKEKEHLEEKHIAVHCDLCGSELEKWMLSKHQEENCPERPVTCEFCEGNIPFEKFSDHFNFCSSRTEKCPTCGNYVMLKDLQKHSEIHSCERRLRSANIEREVKENILNEVISNSGMSGVNVSGKNDAKNYNVNSSSTIDREERPVRIPIEAGARAHELLKESEENDNTYSNSTIVSKDERSIRNRGPFEAGACAPESTKEMSKHYTTCYICKERIPWIDMNTHVPTCASNAGKCSRCGVSVPLNEIKEHILKTCKLLPGKDSSIAKTDSKKDAANRNESRCRAQKNYEQSMEKCPFCNFSYSKDHIVKHKQTCSESYECPLCTDMVAEKDRIKHDSFECRILLQINEDSLYDLQGDDSRNSSEKNKSSKESIPKHDHRPNDRTHSLHNTNGSYADAAGKAKCKEFKEHSVNCQPCCPCRRNSHSEVKEHPYSCQRSEKSHCLYCSEEIDVKFEDIHLNYCKGFSSRNNVSEPKYQINRNGAVPKYSKFADMVKPQVAKCKFCKVTLNANILSYHEKECVHRPEPCMQCDAFIPAKDLEKHTCKSRKGRGKQSKQAKIEEKTQSSSVVNKVKNWIFNPVVNDGCNRNVDMYSNPDADEAKIPCEFCGKLFPASFIVIHETGCKPELVSYSKKETKSSISPKENDTLQHESMSEGNFFSIGNRNVLFNRSGIKKNSMESSVQPGEFLGSMCVTGTPDSAKENEAGKKNKSKSSVIQSVWNFSSPDTETEEADQKILPSAQSFQEMPDKFMGLGEIKRVVEEELEYFQSDDELTECIDFIQSDASVERSHVAENNKETKPLNAECLEESTAKYEEEAKLVRETYTEETDSYFTSGQKYSKVERAHLVEYNKEAKPLNCLEESTDKYEEEVKSREKYIEETASYLTSGQDLSQKFSKGTSEDELPQFAKSSSNWYIEALKHLKESNKSSFAVQKLNQHLLDIDSESTVHSERKAFTAEPSTSEDELPQFAKSSSNWYIEALKNLKESNKSSFAVQKLNQHLLDIDSESTVHSERKAFTVEPSGDHWQRNTSVIGKGEASENNVESDQERSSQKSHYENLEEDLEKWTKWHRRKSS